MTRPKPARPASSDPASSDAVTLVDLRAEPAERRAALLAAFDATLYTPAFPDADIREDPAVWLTAMAEDPGPPWPVVAPILALGPGDAIRGGVVVERYRTANAGFLTYLLVAPEARRSGLGRRLGEAAIRTLAAEAPKDAAPPILFAEAERPELIADAAERAKAEERLRILASLGALVGDLDYVQPPLAPGRAPHRLHLLAAAETLAPDKVAPADRVRAFLDELFRALGCDPERDPNFAAMASEIDQRGGVRFRPL